MRGELMDHSGADDVRANNGADEGFAIPAILDRTGALPAMVERAAQSLASAKTAAEVLEARDLASVAYDAAKRAARLAQAKGAHDEIIARTHRAQADALEIEAGAKRRLADEYDAAQERGEVATGRPKSLPNGNSSATVADIGLSSKDIHEARKIRDAEMSDPGVVRRTLDKALSEGSEPSKAALRRAVNGAQVYKEPEPRVGRRTAVQRSDRAETLRMHTQLWTQFREALQAISGLPAALDLIEIIGVKKTRAELIDEHLPSALQWLKEFSDAWRNRDQTDAQEEDRDDRRDTGVGG